MSGSYPNRIKQLPLYDGRFDAYQLKAQGADVLFASYPAGTTIPSHTHTTDNYGVITKGELLLIINDEVQRIAVGQWYKVPANTEHCAKFEVETDEIEFWFKPKINEQETNER
jgi:quercetin dioxygenase-like cupin family protein